MQQEITRKRLVKFISEKGVSQLPNSVMCVFIKGRKDLYPETLAKLDEFLTKENY